MSQIVTLSPQQGGFATWGAGRRDLSPWAQPPEDSSGVIAHTPDPTKYFFTADGRVMLPRARRGRDSGGSRGFNVATAVVNVDPADASTGMGGGRLDVNEIAKRFPRLLPRWVPSESNGWRQPPPWSGQWVPPEEAPKWAHVFRTPGAAPMPELPNIPELSSWSSKQASDQSASPAHHPGSPPMSTDGWSDFSQQFPPQAMQPAVNPSLQPQDMFNTPQPSQQPQQRHPSQDMPPAWDPRGQQQPQGYPPQQAYPPQPQGFVAPGFAPPAAAPQDDQLSKLAATVEHLARIVTAGQQPAAAPATAAPAPAQLLAVPQAAAGASRPATSDELGLEFLTTPPSSPTVQVVFDLGPGGRISKRYHHYVEYNNVIHLMLDTRAGADEFVPPPTQQGQPFKITLAGENRQLLVYNPDAHCRFGCVDVISLVVVDPSKLYDVPGQAPAGQPLIVGEE